MKNEKIFNLVLRTFNFLQVKSRIYENAKFEAAKREGCVYLETRRNRLFVRTPYLTSRVSLL
jgi:hypothetical protein